jgi:hypothetical protein
VASSWKTVLQIFIFIDKTKQLLRESQPLKTLTEPVVAEWYERWHCDNHELLVVFCLMWWRYKIKHCSWHLQNEITKNKWVWRNSIFLLYFFTLFPIHETATDSVTTVFEKMYILFLLQDCSKIISSYPRCTYSSKKYDLATKIAFDWRNRFLNICPIISKFKKKLLTCNFFV